MVKNAPDECPTADLWHRRRGEIAMLRFVLALEGAEKEQYDRFDELIFEDEESPDTGGNSLEE